MKKSQLRHLIKEEISRIKEDYASAEDNADFTTSDKIVKLLKAAQKLIEDNIENAQNIDLELMGQQIDDMLMQLGFGFVIYDEED